MCGIVGVVARSPVNQLLYDGMTVLQHRGQDAAGIVTAEGHSFHMHKGRGLVRDVFRTRDMRSLVGHMGIAHCRYPTAGSASSDAESQPFYVNSPYGIVLGHNGNLIIGRGDTEKGVEFLVASESVTLDTLGFKVMRDVAPGEAILVDESGNFHSRQCADDPQLNPCIFEFVYLARPDSVIDGISVYEARRNMGRSLADKILAQGLRDQIDVVIPIPDSSRSSALEVAAKLKRQYTEGFIKNRYIGRTFIMPGQEL